MIHDQINSGAGGWQRSFVGISAQMATALADDDVGPSGSPMRSDRRSREKSQPPVATERPSRAGRGRSIGNGRVR